MIKNNVSKSSASYRFPAEFEEHEAVWMGWPLLDFKRGWSVKELHVQLWAALTQQVYVDVAVNPDDELLGTNYEQQVAEIRTLMLKYGVLENRVRLHKIRHSDVWFRDMGPHYLVNDDGELALAQFGFDCWGYEQSDSECVLIDGAVGAAVAREENLTLLRSAMVSEGGDRELNGKGTLLVVEAVERDRNPDMSKEQMEDEFRRLLGVKKVIWLKQGRYDDEQAFRGCLPDVNGDKCLYTVMATGGHIDEHVRFVGPKTIMYTEVTDAEAAADPIAAENKRRFEENLAILRAATDQDGEPFELIAMPSAPTIVETIQPGDGVYEYLRSNKKMQASNALPANQPVQVVLAASYLNFLITNGMTLGQKFWREGCPLEWKALDEQAERILQRCFPDRITLMFDTRAINIGGGGIHCNTQQKPLVL